MNDRVTINHEQHLYVIPHTHRSETGYTCLGFDYAFKRAAAIVEWLIDRGVETALPDPESRGTIRGFTEYALAVHAAKVYFQRTGRRCPAELTPELTGLEGCRVEVIDCYGETRRFYIGRSTGWIPCHLEIARIDSTGGPAVYGTPFTSVRVISPARRRTYQPL